MNIYESMSTDQSISAIVCFISRCKTTTISSYSAKLLDKELGSRNQLKWSGIGLCPYEMHKAVLRKSRVKLMCDVLLSYDLSVSTNVNLSIYQFIIRATPTGGERAPSALGRCACRGECSRRWSRRWQHRCFRKRARIINGVLGVTEQVAFNICIYVYTWTHIYIYIHTCTHVYKYIYIYI